MPPERQLKRLRKIARKKSVGSEKKRLLLKGQRRMLIWTNLRTHTSIGPKQLRLNLRTNGISSEPLSPKCLEMPMPSNLSTSSLKRPRQLRLPRLRKTFGKTTSVLLSDKQKIFSIFPRRTSERRAQDLLLKVRMWPLQRSTFLEIRWRRLVRQFMKNFFKICPTWT